MTAEFLGVLGGAIALKLISSADDVIWLAKLLEGIHGWRLTLVHAVYITTLTFICLMSWVLAELGASGFLALTGEEGWFSLTGSVLLILFAVTALRHEEEEAPELDQDQALVMRVRDAFVISFVGSMDELAVYTVALSTGEIRFSALVLGTIIAGMLTLLIVHGVRFIGTVADVLEKIPMWIIVALLGAAGVIYSLWKLAGG